MGKNLNKLKKLRNQGKVVGGLIDNKVQQFGNRKPNPNKARYHNKKDVDNDFSGEDDFNDDPQDDDNYDYNDDNYDGFGDDRVSMTPAQKPVSFHHFILENQYKDLERSIRGFKDVYNDKTAQWELKRKKRHCFTDEEAEDILRTAQSHLATDIKLGRISKDTFGAYMDALYKQLTLVFERIAEYKYGRYNKFNKEGTKILQVNYAIQGSMKSMNLKIFLELWTRIQMNYSRAIGAAENVATHQSVKGQESLQGDQSEFRDDNRRYT